MQALIDQIRATTNRARPFGSRTTESGAELLGHSPHIAPEAYFHVLFRGLNDREILRLEREMERPIFESYRCFLKHFNGALFYSYALALHGLRFDYRREGDAAWQPFHMNHGNLHEQPRGLAMSDVVFGSYHADGSVLYFREADKMIIRCDRRSGRTFNTWNSFESFLSTELTRLATLFDDKCRLRGGIEQTLPSADLSG